MPCAIRRQDDRLRRQRLEEAGYLVIELWEEEVWFRPHEMVEKVRTGLLDARDRRLRRDSS